MSLGFCRRSDTVLLLSRLSEPFFRKNITANGHTLTHSQTMYLTILRHPTPSIGPVIIQPLPERTRLQRLQM
jgi:hypothetical protein